MSLKNGKIETEMKQSVTELLNHVCNTVMVSSSAGKHDKILIAPFFLMESGNDTDRKCRKKKVLP